MNDERQALVVGTTRFISIVGDPVSQVRSPELYNPRLVKAGANVVLIPLHIPSAAFEAAMPALRQIGNLVGVVFTVPFKERAVRFADEVLPTGRQTGAVNAMRRDPDGRWVADMFDGAGLVRALETLGAPPAGRRILLIGAGGAGRAIAMSLARTGAGGLTLYDLDAGKCHQLARDVRHFYPGCPVAAPESVSAAGHDIIVNATPIGMAPDDGLPVQFGPLDPATVVFDIVPKPDVTPLMAHARAVGCRVGGGRLMIDGQADAVLEFLGFGA